MQDSVKIGRPYRRLAIFVAAWFILGLQGILSIAIVEPYPAVVMPAFPGTANEDGQRLMTALEIEIIYRDGTVSRPDQTDIMKDFRFSSIPSSMRYMFHPDGDRNRSGQPIDAEVLTWLKERASELGNGKTPVEVNFCWRRNLVDLRTADISTVGECERSRVTF